MLLDDSKNVSEIQLEKTMINNIFKLLQELGSGFAFLKRQYHVDAGGRNFYLDLLLYNSKIKSYVVLELKNSEFKPEHVGQLNFYLTLVDKFLKENDDNATFGILLCKSKDEFVAKLSLEDINKPIGISEYKTSNELNDYITKSQSKKNIETSKVMQKILNYTDNKSGHGCNEKAKVMNSNLGNNKRDNV